MIWDFNKVRGKNKAEKRQYRNSPKGGMADVQKGGEPVSW